MAAGNGNGISVLVEIHTEVVGLDKAEAKSSVKVIEEVSNFIRRMLKAPPLIRRTYISRSYIIDPTEGRLYVLIYLFLT